MSGDAAPHVVEDFYGVIQLLSDCSVVHGDESVLIPSVELPYQNVPGGVQWKDVVYDATHGLRLRVYEPPTAGDGANKLPVLVYFHGGGYCVSAIDQSIVHGFCLRAAYELPAVVIFVQYRLAPEHRLPTAIDDGEAFFSWLRGQAALGAGAESADFARTFISGVSAGGNLTHHIMVRVGSGQIVSHPVRVAWYVLINEFFAGVERTPSEANPPANISLLTAEMGDQLWRMSLPVGATKDHPLANPFGPDSPSLEPVALPPALVVASGGDVLYDRVVDYAARLKEMGKMVELAWLLGPRTMEPSGQRVHPRFVYQGAPPSLSESASLPQCILIICDARVI